MRTSAVATPPVASGDGIPAPRTRPRSERPDPGPAPIPDPAPVDRNGPHAYDHLEPELRRYAASQPGDRGREVRRERLIREFLPLVRNLARRFSGPHSADDIEQVGVLGLIKAIDRYDPHSATGGPLAYLVPSVRGEMLRHLRDHTWAMRVPRGLKEMSVSVNRATVSLSQRLGRSPRPSELAEELGVSTGQIVETLGALGTDDPAAALLRRADADPDRGPYGHLADARLPAAQPDPGAPAHPTDRRRAGRALTHPPHRRGRNGHTTAHTRPEPRPVHRLAGRPGSPPSRAGAAAGGWPRPTSSGR